VRTEVEALGACAALAARTVQRGAQSYSERAGPGAPVTADRVAVGTAHRDHAQAIRAILHAGGLPAALFGRDIVSLASVQHPREAFVTGGEPAPPPSAARRRHLVAATPSGPRDPLAS
jgi:hypothetical protein